MKRRTTLPPLTPAEYFLAQTKLNSLIEVRDIADRQIVELRHQMSAGGGGNEHSIPIQATLTPLSSRGRGTQPSSSSVPKKRVVSQDARNRIAAAQKKRWANKRKEDAEEAGLRKSAAAPPAPAPVSPVSQAPASTRRSQRETVQARSAGAPGSGHMPEVSLDDMTAKN